MMYKKQYTFDLYMTFYMYKVLLKDFQRHNGITTEVSIRSLDPSS